MNKQIVTARILLVEDDSSLRELLVDVLKSQGYEVDECSGALEVLTALGSRRKYDIAICDYNLPGVRPENLIRAMGRAMPETPIIIASGDVNLTIEAARVLGASGVLLKPFSAKLLTLQVIGLLQGRLVTQEPMMDSKAS